MLLSPKIKISLVQRILPNVTEDVLKQYIKTLNKDEKSEHANKDLLKVATAKLDKNYLLIFAEVIKPNQLRSFISYWDIQSLTHVFNGINSKPKRTEMFKFSDIDRILSVVNAIECKTWFPICMEIDR